MIIDLNQFQIKTNLPFPSPGTGQNHQHLKQRFTRAISFTHQSPPRKTIPCIGTNFYVKRPCDDIKPKLSLIYIGIPELKPKPYEISLNQLKRK